MWNKSAFFLTNIISFNKYSCFWGVAPHNNLQLELSLPCHERGFWNIDLDRGSFQKKVELYVWIAILVYFNKLIVSSLIKSITTLNSFFFMQCKATDTWWRSFTATYGRRLNQGRGHCPWSPKVPFRRGMVSFKENVSSPCHALTRFPGQKHWTCTWTSVQRKDSDDTWAATTRH